MNRERRRYLESDTPLPVRLGMALVENLPLLLMFAFVGGTVFMARDLLEIAGELSAVADDPESPPAPIAPPPARQRQHAPGTLANREGGQAGAHVQDRDRAADRRFDEAVEHWRSCTYTEYREANYDACVPANSRIYRRPGHDKPGPGGAV